MQIEGINQAHGVQQVKPSPHFNNKPAQTEPQQRTQGPDELQISPEADLISRTRDVPEIRADRVAEIRAQIESGQYETQEKLDIAVSRLLDELA